MWSKLGKFPGNEKCFCPTRRRPACPLQQKGGDAETWNFESLERGLPVAGKSGAAKVIPGRPSGCTHTIQLRIETNQKLGLQLRDRIISIHYMAGLPNHMDACVLSCRKLGLAPWEGWRVGPIPIGRRREGQTALLGGLSGREQRRPRCMTQTAMPSVNHNVCFYTNSNTNKRRVRLTFLGRLSRRDQKATDNRPKPFCHKADLWWHKFCWHNFAPVWHTLEWRVNSRVILNCRRFL